MTNLRGGVCAIVVTYNRCELLKECVSNLLGISDDLLNKIIIINNCSTDDTNNYLCIIEKNYSERIEIINLKENIGGSGGFNVGLKLAARQNYSWSWMMDDDTIVSSEALEELLKSTKNIKKNISFICSKVLWTDGSLNKMNLPKFHNKNLGPLPTGEMPVMNATFVSILINMKAVTLVGLPYKEYFIWTDDVEYTWRLNNYSNGLKGYYNPKSVVLHKTSENIGHNITSAPVSMAWRFYYQMRNETHYRRQKGILFIPWIESFFAYRRKIKRIKQRKDIATHEIFLKQIKKGFIDGLTFNPNKEFI